ncbi:type I methionyl aminopeptidase [Ruminococcaceae bacterium OttesenSCG-928-N02]|nr:type I methionyl aminopeptidase [Ruminococcaceae bacterium OttesenSCG-928-N02]
MISIKTPADIEKMREAGRISAYALQVAREVIHPGMTTAALNKEIHRAIVSQGAVPNFLNLYGFPASACISVNDEVIHGIPGPRKLQNGDIVSVDVGAVKNGFHGDNAYTFVVGETDPETMRLLQVTQEALALGIAAAQPGARVGDIGYAIQSYVEAEGFSVVREYVGHGIGSALHEDPQVPNFGSKGRGPRLIPGMTIAIEPMINAGEAAIYQLQDGWTVKTKDGKMSAHFENTVLITKDGPVILTKV